MVPESSDPRTPSSPVQPNRRAAGLLGWSLAALGLGGIFLYSHLRTEDLDGLLAGMRNRVERVEKDQGPEQLGRMLAASLDREREHSLETFVSRSDADELERRLGENRAATERLADTLDATRREATVALSEERNAEETLTRLEGRIEGLDGDLAAIAKDLDSIEIPEIDPEKIIDSAAQRAEAAMSRKTKELGRRIEATRATLEEIRRALPDPDTLRESITARVLDVVREANLLKARRMMRSTNDLTRALGVHLLVDLEPATVEAELRPFLTDLDPDSYPQATQAILTLLGDHRAASVRALLVRAVLGSLNDRLTPYGMALLAGLDYGGRHADLAPPVLAATLKAAHIDNPERFYAVIDILRALDSSGALSKTLTSAPPEITAALERFYENYVASRVLGYDPQSAVFPVEDPAQLLAGGRPSPRLGEASRRRALELARIARTAGLAKKSARFTLSLRRFTRPQGDETRLLHDLLRELAGWDLGAGWTKWDEWAGSSGAGDPRPIGPTPVGAGRTTGTPRDS